jgi:KTSC domain
MEKSTGWVPLSSSVLRAAQYFEETNLLYLEFTSGAVYRYFEFPAQQYNGLLTTASHGKYFNHQIRHRFREEMVRPPDPR